MNANGTNPPPFNLALVVKALRALGSRAKSQQIAMWIFENAGSGMELKKVRYKVIGILSAKCNNQIFYQNPDPVGEWILMEDMHKFTQLSVTGPPKMVIMPKNEKKEKVKAKPNLSVPSPPSQELSPTESSPVVAMNVCCVCGIHEKGLLRCDSCDREFHLHCLTPELQEEPRGLWTCNDCPPIIEEYSDLEGLSDVDLGNIIGSKKKTRGPPGACKKHKSMKKKCPPECPGRKEMPSATTDNKRRRTIPPEYDEKVLPYIRAIDKAIHCFGGTALLEDIVLFIAKNMPEITETALMLRGCITSALLNYYICAPVLPGAPIIWTAEKQFESEDTEWSVSPNYMKKLVKENWEGDYTPSAIEYINFNYQLHLQQTQPQHPGAVMRAVWNHTGTKLATISTQGTVRIWNVDDWSLHRQLTVHGASHSEELYALEWSFDDKKVIVGGKVKDVNDLQVPSEIKIMDVESELMVLKLAGHMGDVLDIKLVSFLKDSYLLSVGGGTLSKWQLTCDLTYE